MFYLLIHLQFLYRYISYNGILFICESKVRVGIPYKLLRVNKRYTRILWLINTLFVV